MNILLIEDNLSDAQLFEEAIFSCRGSHQVEKCLTLSSAIHLFGEIDALVSDLELPDSESENTLSVIYEQKHIPVIVLTGVLQDKELAYKLGRKGLFYIPKSDNLELMSYQFVHIIGMFENIQKKNKVIEEAFSAF